MEWIDIGMEVNGAWFTHDAMDGKSGNSQRSAGRGFDIIAFDGRHSTVYS